MGDVGRGRVSKIFCRQSTVAWMDAHLGARDSWVAAGQIDERRFGVLYTRYSTTSPLGR